MTRILFALILVALIVCLAVPAAAQLPTKVVSKMDTTKTFYTNSVIQVGSKVTYDVLVKCENATATNYITLAFNNDTSATQVIYIFGGNTSPTYIRGVTADSVKISGISTGIKYSFAAIKPF